MTIGLKEEKLNPNRTAHEKATQTYKELMKVEAYAVLMTLVSSLLFGWVYEAFKRSRVLIICFILLGVSMAVPYTVELGDYSTTITRICVCVLTQAILQNPLLIDYVKKRNRGWANGWQRLGYTIGEIITQFILYKELHKDKEAQDKIYYTMTGMIIFLGVFVGIFIIKDRTIPRTYVEDT